MQISNAEWRIMKIIWMEGKQTSTDLIAVLSERPRMPPSRREARPKCSPHSKRSISYPIKASPA